MSIKHREDSITGIRKREAQQTKIAESAVLTDGSIHLTLPGGHVCDGTMVKFCAPCSCDVVTGGIVINGETYTVVDSMLNCVTGFGGVWDVGAQISVVIDNTNKRAFLNNTIDPLPTLKLSAPPTLQTVGLFGQHAIYKLNVYVCVGIITNSEETKYIWVLCKSEKATKDLLIITQSQTLDITTLGLKQGDEIIVACISGGNGGGSTGTAIDGKSYTNQALSGAAGKGGQAGISFSDTTDPDLAASPSAMGDRALSAGAGGGGAGGGMYGVGGGGAGGGAYQDTSNWKNRAIGGCDGGNGGGCEVQPVTLTSDTVAITIGAGGTAHGGVGGTTSFGSYFSVEGGTGSKGGKGGAVSPNDTDFSAHRAGGGGGSGGDGWTYVSGYEPTPGNDGQDGMAGDSNQTITVAGTNLRDFFIEQTAGDGASGTGEHAGIGGVGSRRSIVFRKNTTFESLTIHREPTAGTDNLVGSGSGAVFIWY